jgi:hypothetical protein
MKNIAGRKAFRKMQVSKGAGMFIRSISILFVCSFFIFHATASIRTFISQCRHPGRRFVCINVRK